MAKRRAQIKKKVQAPPLSPEEVERERAHQSVVGEVRKMLEPGAAAKDTFDFAPTAPSLLPIAPSLETMEAFWNARLDHLKSVLEQDEPNGTP